MGSDLWLAGLIDHLAPEMTDRDVSFLDARSARGGHGDDDVAQRSEGFG